MKRYIIALLAAVGVCGGAAAQIKTAYFMEGSYFRTDMNPALAPTRGYIQMPGLGGIGVSMNNNFLSVENFLYKRDGNVVTFLNNGVPTDDFLKKLPNTGKLDVDTQVNILGFGGHTKKMFWNAGINVRANAELAMKKDVFRLLKTLGSGHYDLTGTNVAAQSYLEMYVGFAIPIKDYITIGFRVKGLIGAANAKGDITSMYADVTDEAVRAELAGNIRGNSPYFRNDYEVGEEFDFDKIKRGDFKDVLKNIKSGGAAVDLGVEVRLLDDRLKVSGAITDLGFICWHGNSTVNLDANGFFNYEGVDFDKGDAISDSDFNATMAQPSGKYTSRLNCALNLGVEYNILNNHIAFGLLSHSKFCQTFSYTELTASVNFRLGRWFTTTLSHTFLNHNKLGIFGFALNMHPAGLNLFLGADYIGCSYAKLNDAPIPKTMRSANFYFGLGFNLGKAKYMKSMQPQPKKRK